MATLSGNNIQKASWSSKFGIHFYWSGNQSYAGNYTDITVDIYGWLDYYAYLDIGSRTGSISIAGDNSNVWMPAVTKYDSNVREIKLATRTVRVWHNDDGTLPNVYISAVWPIQAYIDEYYRYDISCGFNTGEINRIPRASSISSNSSFTIGNDFPVAIQRASDSFKHDVFLKINDSNFKTVSKIDTNYIFTFTDSDIENLYELTKNNASIDCSLICDTYSDNTKIGTTTKNGKVYVDEASNKPVFEEFTFEPIDLGTKELTGWTSEISDDNGLSIKGKTIYQINCGQATPKNKSTIARYELELNKKISSSTNSVITANSPVEYDDFLSVSAVDSRGFKTTISKKIVCQNYENIKPVNAEIERQKYPNNTKVKINFRGTISKSNTLNNTATAYYRFNDRSNYEEKFSDWKKIDIVVVEDGNISITDMMIDNFELKNAYDFELKITDYYSETIIKAIITTDEPILSIKEDGIYSLNKKINDSIQEEALWEGSLTGGRYIKIDGLNSYKRIKCLVNMYVAPSNSGPCNNTGGSANILEIDLSTPYDNFCRAGIMIPYKHNDIANSDGVETSFFFVIGQVNIQTNEIGFSMGLNNVVNQSDYYTVRKIWGIK